MLQTVCNKCNYSNDFQGLYINCTVTDTAPVTQWLTAKSPLKLDVLYSIINTGSILFTRQSQTLQSKSSPDAPE